MGDLWWIAVLFAYLLVGGLLLLRQSTRHTDFAPRPDWSGVVLLLAWPLILAGWALFRGPEPPITSGRVPAPVGDRLPPAGKAVNDLCPRGTVEVAGRRHAATAEGGPVRAGEAVEIIGRVGRVLRVRGCRADPVVRPDTRRQPDSDCI